MFNLEQIKELLPKRLQCKKESRYEELVDYRYDVFWGYDENNQIYTITRDKKGNLHVLERDLEEEEKSKYEAIKAIGEEMTFSSAPSSFSYQQRETVKKDAKPKRKIILTPIKDKLKKGYETIVIEFGDTRYSILNNNGNIELQQDGKCLEISPDEKNECLDILRKPFDVSLIDRIKMSNISYSGDDRLHHIEQTNQYKSVFIPITPERMREWDEAEK